MLSQDDFVYMLRDMQKHVEKTIKITEELVSQLEDRDLRFKLIALRQTKHMHLEAMAALTALVNSVRNQSKSIFPSAQPAAKPVPAGK